MSSPRLRRLKSDHQKVIEEFTEHPYIDVETEEIEVPEKYFVVYNLPGLNLVGDSPEEINRHEVAFYLERGYPQKKPVCKIKTSIFHPNFHNGNVCIGDHWSAGGETLVDLIVKVGDMIQYKEYNTKSPLNAKAARWTAENEELFPISNIDLYREELELDLEDEDWSIEIHCSEEEDLDFDIDIKN